MQYIQQPIYDTSERYCQSTLAPNWGRFVDIPHTSRDVSEGQTRNQMSDLEVLTLTVQFALMAPRSAAGAPAALILVDHSSKCLRPPGREGARSMIRENPKDVSEKREGKRKGPSSLVTRTLCGDRRCRYVLVCTEQIAWRCHRSPQTEILTCQGCVRVNGMISHHPGR